jgi:hypothetical protein
MRPIVTEHLLKIPLEDLKTVRVICRNAVCGAIVEVPVTKLEAMFKAGECPVCRRQFIATGATGNLVDLGKVLDGLAENKALGIEFVIATKPHPD